MGNELVNIIGNANLSRYDTKIAQVIELTPTKVLAGDKDHIQNTSNGIRIVIDRPPSKYHDKSIDLTTYFIFLRKFGRDREELVGKPARVYYSGKRMINIEPLNG